MKTFTTLAVGTLLAVGLSSHANAQGKGTESTLTVTDPVEVPGTILAPGTYVIRVVDIQNNRNIVQITDVGGTKVFATALCTPHARAASRPNTSFVYFPNVTTGKVLRTWIASNEQFGQDFVYPRDRAIELARVVKEPVPAYVATGPVTGEQLKTVEITPIDEEKSPVAAAPAPPPPVLVAEKKLPATASVFPLAAGLGLLAVAGAAGLHLIGRRIG